MEVLAFHRRSLAVTVEKAKDVVEVRTLFHASDGTHATADALITKDAALALAYHILHELDNHEEQPNANEINKSRGDRQGFYHGERVYQTGYPEDVGVVDFDIERWGRPGSGYVPVRFDAGRTTGLDPQLLERVDC